MEKNTKNILYYLDHDYFIFSEGKKEAVIEII